MGEECPPLSLEERLERMEKRLADAEMEIVTQNMELVTQKDLLFGFCERDILILGGGEILKWSVEKQGDIDGDIDGHGRQFFDSDPAVQQMVFLGCCAFGEYGPNSQNRDLKMFKDLSCMVILAHNAIAQCETLEALERMVRGCRLAITKWPELELKYPAQVKIISHYSKFKLLLPNSFQ